MPECDTDLEPTTKSMRDTNCCLDQNGDVKRKEKKWHIQYSTSLLVFEGFQFANRFKQNKHFGYIFVDFLKLYV